MKAHNLFFLTILIAVVGVSGFYLGYRQYSLADAQYTENNRQEEALYRGGGEKAAASDGLPESRVNLPVAETVTASTKIVYEYYYTEDGTTEIIEEEPPYYLLGETREDLANAFPDWIIQSFSASEVVMRKVIEGKSVQHYIVSEHEGFVAVFYEKEINGDALKELTDTPIQTLPEEEQLRLQEGIRVFGDAALNKMLEDYGS